MARPTTRKTIGGAVGAGVLALALLFGPAALAQNRATVGELPALLSADEVVVDDDLGLVTAQGHVEISQGERLLKADQLTFNRRTNVVTASGNVTIVEPTGEVIFSDFVELTSDLRDGIMRNLRLLIADQSRFAAVTARRADGSKTVMRKATYSPCEPCREDPTRAPVWQIRAKRITHDQEEKQIEYNDAWLEVAGVPVFYSPYFAHPDGTEKRKSGFLVPDISTSSRNGTMIAAPYFWALTPSSDVTVTPIVLSDDNPLLSFDYRERTRAGNVSFDASALNTRREGEGFPTWRGHARGVGNFDIDDKWRWGYDLARTSDKSYLDRYRIRQRFNMIEQNVLESRLFAEGFEDRQYSVVNMFAFQGLRPEDDPRRTPLALPYAAHSWSSEPGAIGGRYTFDANAVSIYRDTGMRTQRGTMIGGWALPYTTRTGEVYTLSTSVRADMFNVQAIEPGRDQFQAESNGSAMRVMPQIGLSWRYPLVQRSGRTRTLVEPIAAVYTAPNLGSQREFANEDSMGLTFDDTNLFRANRFTGHDRLESGQRFVYGVNTEVARTGQRYGVFVGQQFRYEKEAAAPVASGLDRHFSDLVSRVLVQPHTYVTASSRLQVRSDTRELVRSVSNVTLGPPAIRVSVTHFRIDRSIQPTALASINQIGTALVARVTENWRLQSSVSQSLARSDRGILVAGGALVYEDDCVIWGLELQRRNIGRAEYPPDTAIFMRVGLRNLGETVLRGL
jgi:LPS-assembly protein